MKQAPLYDNKPIDFSLKPVVFSREDANYIEKELTSLLGTIEACTVESLAKPLLLKKLGIPAEVAGALPTPLGVHIPFARFDFFYSEKKLTVLELNTDGASGYNVVEWLGDHAKIPDSENPNKNLSLRLLEALQAHNPNAKELGLIDFEDVKTRSEQNDLIETWSNKVNAKMFSPGVRSWLPNSLIYRRALSWQLRSQRERAKPFLDDWAQGKITVVGSWGSDVGMSKALPAIFKLPHFPETHLIDELLAAKIKEQRELWVLKGALSFAGGAVIRGLDLSDEKWLSALEKVCEETRQERPWIAQKFVEVPLVEGKPCEFGLYFLNGKPSGYLCRWGAAGPISDKSEELMRPVQITS
jgi:glutathionylspermidine synthase